MNKRRWSVGLGVALGFGAALGYVTGRARAAGIPTTDALTYSGVLTDVNGAPLTGSKNIQVQLVDAAVDGTIMCTVGPAAVPLVAGTFQIGIGDCTAAIRAKPDLWAEVFVDGASTGRTKLGVVPYAIEAAHAVSASQAADALDQRIANLEQRINTTKVIDAVGALPLTSNALVTKGGKVLLFVSGSAYYTSSSASLTVAINLDGAQVGVLKAYTNEGLSHKTLISKTVVVPTLAAGAHTVELRAVGTTATDPNDSFSVTALELP